MYVSILSGPQEEGSVILYSERKEPASELVFFRYWLRFVMTLRCFDELTYIVFSVKIILALYSAWTNNRINKIMVP